MIVTAALPWWNERPEDLDACVRAAANVADRIVALDGAYARYPDATTHSDPAQAEAIKAAAKDVGLDCQVIAPDRLWAGQVEKRSDLLAIAGTNTDWIVTIDADHVIHTDRDAIRKELERTTADVLAVEYYTPANNDVPIMEAAAGFWHIQQQALLPVVPHIWRPLPGLRVEKFHWWYSAIQGGRRVWLWAPREDETYPASSYSTVRTHYQVEHRCFYRTPEQVLASRAFLNDREMVVEMTGQEDDRPGLPRPRYNYQRLPL